MAKAENGNGPSDKVEPFKVELDAVGVMHGYIKIAERVMNGEVETNQAKEATRALDGVPKMYKTQLEALRMFDKGSSARVREEAGKILGMSSQQAIEDNSDSKKQ